jgi:predicted phosphodiesterase
MQYLVLTDMHGNIDALDAVLQVAGPGVDQILVLGDLVGYGADPNAVVQRIREIQPRFVIRGNHDKVASGLEEPVDFNPVARRAVQWTREALTPDHREYLAHLPAGPEIVDDVVEICHGAPFDEDAYIFDELDATRAIAAARRRVCLFGHTHIPVIFASPAGVAREPLESARDGLVVRLEPGTRYLINPGAVGQPRDGDPRAAYAVLDTGDMELKMCRVEYDVERAQAKIVAAGLPDVLADRLGMGR